MSDISLCVALTGATGFVGRHILPRLLEKGHRVRLLQRGDQKLHPSPDRVNSVRGDLFDRAALTELCRGADAVVHVVGIINEQPGRGQTFERIHTQGTHRLLSAAQAAGVKKWVHMSALGARPEAPARYHQTKWLAEQAVRRSGLDHTIFRPSIIHGHDGEFMRMIRDFWCNAFPPFVPFFSRKMSLRDIVQIKAAVLWPFPSLRRPPQPGRYVSRASAGMLQPVYVEDVARCFVDALTNPRAAGETYPLGGPDPFTWPELFVTCRDYLPRARNKKVAAIPAWYARMIAGLPGVPFNADQVTMSQEDSTCQIAKVQEDFQIALLPFESTFAEYAHRIE